MHEIDSLPVPKFDFAVIKARAERRRPRRSRVLELAAFVVLVPALAAAATTYFHPGIYSRGNTLHVYAYSLNVNVRPSDATLAAIVRNAPFRVVLPEGLPAYVQLKTTSVADSELISLDYSCPGKRRLNVMIAPTTLLSLAHPLPDPHGHVTMTPRVTGPWHTFVAGDERVRLETNCLSDAQIAKVRSAMMAAGAAQR